MPKVIINGEMPKFNIPIPRCYINLVTKCLLTNPEDRPTFQEIVKELRTNKEFIINTIDENEFFDFVDLFDDTEWKFEPNKKLKLINSEEKTERSSSSDIESNEFLISTNNLLIFLLKMNVDENEHYFIISDEDEDSLIEEICKEGMKITLSYNALEINVGNSSIDSSEFSNYINEK